jgi:hypothetical protein
MSAPLRERELGPLRNLREEEIAIIKKMVAGTSLERKVDRQLTGLRVQNMPDGGMGSLKFHTGTPRLESEYGKQIAEASFQDADGIPVSATLSVDRAGRLFELDMFKANGAPLVRYPDLCDLKVIKRHGKLGYPA